MLESYFQMFTFRGKGGMNHSFAIGHPYTCSASSSAREEGNSGLN